MMQSLKCPEEGCHVNTEVFVPPMLISREEYNLNRACPKHKKKYLHIYEEHVQACKRYGITP